MKLRSLEFRREREQAWSELESLLDQIDKRGLASLTAEDLSRLPMLYRGALSALSVARAISLDRNVVEYLEALTARAYYHVYGARRHLRETLSAFFLERLPRTVRELRGPLLLAALFMLAGFAVGFLATLGDMDRFFSFMSPGMSMGRDPSASTETLRSTLYDAGGGAKDRLAAFASFLFTHNARIGILAFALGFAAGLPVFLLLFINGLSLGAFAALFHARGLSVELWAWLLPHGVTELLAVVLCGAAGLAIARSLLFPGRHTRLANLAIEGRRAAMLVVGCVSLFFIAGLIEGIFRQTVHDVGVRYAVAAGTAALWIVYFGWVGRRRGVAP